MTSRAIVTGGSKGIGRVVALRLARQNAAVAICYKDDGASAAETTRIAKVDGQRVISFRCDVADPAEVSGFVDSAAEALGGIDVLVNNAGELIRSGAWDTQPLDDILSMIQVNYLGALACARHPFRIFLRANR